MIPDVEPAAARPLTFRRGYNVYDPRKVGFVTEGAEAERVGTLHDTRQKGGSNRGHEYGTALADGDKDALVEYLKSL